MPNRNVVLTEHQSELIRRIDGSLAEYTATGALDEAGATTIRRVFARAREDQGGAVLV